MKRVCLSPLPQSGYRASPRRRLWWHRQAAAARAVALAIAFGSAGCSYQLNSLRNRNGSEVERTGPIAQEVASEGDLAVARAAASEMLGKGGKTASMPWENPRTGARGTITPLASAYSQDGLICHDFLASYVRDSSASWLEGEACRAMPGRWEVRKLKPRQRSDDRGRTTDDRTRAY